VRTFRAALDYFDHSMVKAIDPLAVFVGSPHLILAPRDVGRFA